MEGDFKYLFPPGEIRWIWLDEDGLRVSPYHKSVGSAHAFKGIMTVGGLGSEQVTPSLSNPSDQVNLR